MSEQDHFLKHPLAQTVDGGGIGGGAGQGRTEGGFEDEEEDAELLGLATSLRDALDGDRTGQTKRQPALPGVWPPPNLLRGQQGGLHRGGGPLSGAMAGMMLPPGGMDGAALLAASMRGEVGG